MNGLDRIVQAATLLRNRPAGPEGLPERLATDRFVVRSRSQPERGSAFVNGRVVLVAALVAIALLAAGCGGGSASPSVASLGATDATGTAGMSSRSPGGGGTAASALRRGAVAYHGGVAFSACMRSHGVPDFPDPNGRGMIEITASSGLDPNSPRFRSAEKQCQKLIPNGPPPTPAQTAKAHTLALKYAACMRSHGVPSFPDPTFSNGNIGQRGIDPNSPQFEAAGKACASLDPFSP